jgi:hypothetical protein
MVRLLAWGIETLPVNSEWGPWPSEEELEAANADRYYSGDTPLTLTVEDIGLYDVPIVESNNDKDLDQGLYTCLKPLCPGKSGSRRTST